MKLGVVAFQVVEQQHCLQVTGYNVDSLLTPTELMPKVQSVTSIYCRLPSLSLASSVKEKYFVVMQIDVDERALTRCKF